jgi:hypothetical protein
MRQRPLVLSFAVAAALTSCGGGDSATGTVEGLQGPQQVSIIDSNSTVSAVRLPRGVSAVTGSDYETDQTRFWVRDDSMKVLDTVNMILSSLDQTRYWEQTNEGAYRALVEEEETGGGERGNQGPVYKVWTVDSTRASSSAPQIVKFWLDETDAMGTNIPAIIYGRLTVTEEPSDTNPLGSFNLFFKCLPVSEPSTSTATMFEGYMRTVPRTDGQSEIEFFNGHGDPEGSVGSGDYATRERVHVVANPHGRHRPCLRRVQVRAERRQPDQHRRRGVPAAVQRRLRGPARRHQQQRPEGARPQRLRRPACSATGLRQHHRGTRRPAVGLPGPGQPTATTAGPASTASGSRATSR